MGALGETTTSSSAALVVGVAAGVLVSVVVALVLVVLVVANRAEPDSRGVRPFSVYLFAVSFVALWAAYTGSVVVVTTLTSLIPPHAVARADAVARGCTTGAIVTVLAGVLLWYHLGRGRRLAWGDGRVDGPNCRVLHSYVAAVAFVAVIVAVVSLGVAVYLLCQLAGPGTFRAGSGRAGTVEALLGAGYVSVAAAAIAWLHLRLGPRQLLPQLLRHPAGPMPPPPGTVPPGTVPPGTVPPTTPPPGAGDPPAPPQR